MNKGESNLGTALIKIFVVLILFALQIFIILFLLKTTREIELYANAFFELVKLVLVLIILYKPGNPSFKIAWIILIMFFPVFGFLLYLFSGNLDLNRRIKKRKNEFDKLAPTNINTDLKEIPKEVANQFNFIKNTTGLPVYKASTIKYLKIGEEYLEEMMKDLKKAKKYILFEYFIISKSQTWDKVFEILKQKSKEGVKIYFSFDEIGSLFCKPKKLKENLKDHGINVVSFNPITPILRLSLNYRNHRKITVIDGKVAYTGGINIGDEYANIDHRLGHWKDVGIRITGKPINSFIKMFAQMWYYHTKEILKLDPAPEEKETSGYIMPYCDGPDNKKNPAEMVYLNMINSAKETIYITTPYLIIDNEMITALTNAARKGVDVKIVTPGIPDKKVVKACTVSFYGELLESGVEIYEYTPGFIHAKICLVDDNLATVGTINFDYRSLYHHYECGVLIYDTKEESKIKEDVLEIISKSKKINLKKWQSRSFFTKVKEAILKAISPML